MDELKKRCAHLKIIKLLKYIKIYFNKNNNNRLVCFCKMKHRIMQNEIKQQCSTTYIVKGFLGILFLFHFLFFSV